ncbi:recombinase family protein, partial [Gluconobacter kondonii]|uniref:recombinase family protein n=1 Tax=Gluconobacter kondonii TaxID=941463 RepID=UPI002011E844
LLKTQIESSPENRQSNRQKPEITKQAHQSTVLRSLQIASRLTEQGIRTAKGGKWTAAAVTRVL